MTFIKNFIYKFHFLSFDVAIGTLIQAISIQKFTEYTFPNDYLILLPFTTLIIYWLDRLLDVYKLNKNLILTHKHNFYKKNFQPILWLTFLLSIVICIKGIFFSVQEVQNLGIYGGFIVSIYFFINHIFKGNSKLNFFKELTIAFVYSLVLWILPLIFTFSLVNFLAFICLFFHALLNLWIISLWDKELDIQMHTHSFALTTWIYPSIYGLIFLTFILCGVLTVWNLKYGSVNFLMLLAHGLLLLQKPGITQRILIELVFWIPLLYCIV